MTLTAPTRSTDQELTREAQSAFDEIVRGIVEPPLTEIKGDITRQLASHRSYAETSAGGLRVRLDGLKTLIGEAEEAEAGDDSLAGMVLGVGQQMDDVTDLLRQASQASHAGLENAQAASANEHDRLATLIIEAITRLHAEGDSRRTAEAEIAQLLRKVRGDLIRQLDSSHSEAERHHEALRAMLGAEAEQRSLAQHSLDQTVGSVRASIISELAVERRDARDRHRESQESAKQIATLAQHLRDHQSVQGKAVVDLADSQAELRQHLEQSVGALKVRTHLLLALVIAQIILLGSLGLLAVI